MKIKPSLIASTIALTLTTTFTTSCSNNQSKNFDEQKIILLNNLQNDEYCKNHSDIDKILTFKNMIDSDKNNFIVIDKKNCTSTVYNSQGDTLFINEILLGKSIGDNNPIEQNYTPPGEYKIVGKDKDYGEKNKKLYSNRLMPIIDETKARGDKFLALHQIPNNVYQIRARKLDNNTTQDNRVSNGCINYSKEDYDKMNSLINGDNTNVYILPEENDNFLKLTKKLWGKYQFKQVKF